MKILNLENDKRKFTQNIDNFFVLEHLQDSSVSPSNAIHEYYMSKMGVRRKQVLCKLDKAHSVITQAGAMQMIMGNIDAKTDVKGVGDLFGKAIRSAVTNEGPIKPKYVGEGILFLEPTYKYIILEDVAKWGNMCIEDGMFLACDANVNLGITRRKSISSAVLGGEGLFNLSLSGQGVVALESNVPQDELITVELENETLKVDGKFAIAWSSSLDFTVERTTKTLIGSAASGEGLVNVYRGTGKVLLAPITDSSSLYEATNDVSAKTASKGSNSY